MKLQKGLCLALAISAMAIFTARAENPPQSIHDFVGSHYKELQVDLGQGDGSSLASLLDLLRILPEDKEVTVKRLRALSDAYPTPSGFADRVPDFARTEQAPVVSSVSAASPLPVQPAMSESDLVTFFAHMKYKTRIHLSMLNGDEIDGTFSSFDPSREIIFVNPAGSSGMFGKKVYALQKMKTVSQIP